MGSLALTNVGVEIDGRWLVRNVNVSLKSGTLTAFVGPNGSGKTTLLRVMAALQYTSEGEASLNNINLRSYNRRDIARHISFVPQDTHVGFAFTVKEVVMMGRHAHLGKFQREGAKDREAVNDALKRADIVHLVDRYVTELSGGERQRVIIARSLATESNIVLLDEPTANLDVAHALDILALCQKLAQDGKAVCIALHDINAAARYADEIVLMNAGRVFKQGAPEEVFQEDSLNEVFEVYTDRTQTNNGKPVFVFYRKNMS